MTKRIRRKHQLGGGVRPDIEGESLLNRRSLLAGTAGLVGAMLMGAVTPSAEAATENSPEDPTRVPGTAPTAYGQRSAFEQAVRVPRSWWASLTPLQDSHGILTPSALHFERHHNGVPIIQSGASPAHHSWLG